MGHVPVLDDLAIVAALAVAMTVILSKLQLPTVAELLAPAPLIVLGARSHSVVTRALLGSVARVVSERASEPRCRSSWFRSRHREGRTNATW